MKNKFRSCRRIAATCAALCLCLSGLPLAPVSAAPHTPAVGSSERQAIMDAMRAVVGKGQKKRVVFLVTHLSVEKGWAYYTGECQYADGSRFGDDAVGGNLAVLLHREGKGKSAWRVRYHAFHGDVIEPEIEAKFPQAPRSIF